MLDYCQENGIVFIPWFPTGTISEALRQEAGSNLRVTGISPEFVKTNLAGSIKNPEIKKSIIDKAEKIAIEPNAIAEAVVYAIEQPNNVNVATL